MSRRPFFSPPLTSQYGSPSQLPSLDLWRIHGSESRRDPDSRFARLPPNRGNFNVAIRNSPMRCPNDRGFSDNYNKHPIPHQDIRKNSHPNVSTVTRLQQIKKRRSFEAEERQKKMKREDDNTVLFGKQNKIICFMSPQAIAEFKREIHLRGQRSALIDEICKFNARYQYNMKTKGVDHAERYSAKKPDQRNFHCCTICDQYFSDQRIFDIHLKTLLHREIAAIYRKLQELSKDWLESGYNTKNSLRESTQLAEKAGIMIKIEGETNTKGMFQEINISGLTLEEFVLKAYEEQMKDIWPQPKSDYYCRTCNYSEFATKELLDRHVKSARHLDFQRHYEEAFCISCQHHCGDSRGIEQHSRTSKHEQAENMLEFTKLHATSYWYANKDKANKTDSNIQTSTEAAEKTELKEVEKCEQNVNNRNVMTKKEISVDEEESKQMPSNIKPQNEDNVIRDMWISKSSSLDENKIGDLLDENEIGTSLDENKIGASLDENKIEEKSLENILDKKIDKSLSQEIRDDNLPSQENICKKSESRLSSQEKICENSKSILPPQKNNYETSESDLQNCRKCDVFQEIPMKSIELNNEVEEGRETIDTPVTPSPEISTSTSDVEHNQNTKSQITQLLDMKQRNRDLEAQLRELNDKINEFQKAEKQSNGKEIESESGIEDSVDDFIVPLTGYMCTVCHETISEEEEVELHRKSKVHQQNVQSYRLKYAGLQG